MNKSTINRAIINILMLAFIAAALPACDDIYHTAQKQIKNGGLTSLLATVFSNRLAPYQAQGLSYTDMARDENVIDGNLVVLPPADPNVYEFHVYWGTSSSTKLYATWNWQTPNMGTASSIYVSGGIPIGATHLLVYSCYYDPIQMMAVEQPRPTALRIPDMVARMVYDLNTSGSSFPSYLTIYNYRLHYNANDGGGFRLFAYDGTNPSPTLIGGSYDTTSFTGMKVYNNELYFGAGYGALGYELLKCDASGLASPVQDIMPGGIGSNPSHFAVFNNKLFFQASNSTQFTGSGAELYSTTGSTVTLAHDLYPGYGAGDYPNESMPMELTVYNNRLYFTATPNGSRRDIYTYEEPFYLSAIINPNSTSPNPQPQGLIVYNGKLFFSADKDQYTTYGRQLYSFHSSSPALQAEPVHDSLYPYLNPINMAVYNNRLYFQGSDTANGGELWVYDDRTPMVPPQMIADINPGTPGSGLAEFVVYDNKLYFSASNGGNFQLWVYDDAMPVSLGDPWFPNPRPITSGEPTFLGYPKVFNNGERDVLYFQGSDSTNGAELWEYFVK